MKFLDGSITINFTNNDAHINVIHTCAGWAYTIRYYEPEQEILDQDWTMPKLEPLT